MRRCGIHKCLLVNDSRCCLDCNQLDCENRCKNHPDRCKCVRDAKKRNPGQGRPRKIDQDRVLALAKAGMSNYSIAIELECSHSWVVRVLRQLGYTRPKARKGGEPDGE